MTGVFDAEPLLAFAFDEQGGGTVERQRDWVNLDNDTLRNVTLLVGDDDDHDVFENENGFRHLIERFQDG